MNDSDVKDTYLGVVIVFVIMSFAVYFSTTREETYRAPTPEPTQLQRDAYSLSEAAKIVRARGAR